MGGYPWEISRETILLSKKILGKILFTGYRFTGSRFIVCIKVWLCTPDADKKYSYMTFQIRKIIETTFVDWLLNILNTTHSQYLGFCQKEKL